MFIKTLDKSGESKQLFYHAIKEAGYNAVLDQHDVSDSWMQASRPLIIMNALNTLGDMKVSDISSKEIEQALKDLNYI
jgi:PP-loop superfamily ATP-utilizing enzyme